MQDHHSKANTPCTLPAQFHIERNDRFLLIARVSSWEQRKNASLPAQLTNMRKAVEQNGGVVVGELKFAESGRGLLWMDHLNKITKQAKILDATPLFACMSRLLRSDLFNPKDKVLRKAKPTERECRGVEAIQQAAGCKPFMVLLDATMGMDEQQGILMRWAMEEAKSKGGGSPGGRRHRKEKWQPVAKELRALGLSIDAIVREIQKRSGGRHRPSRSTIWEWVR